MTEIEELKERIRKLESAMERLYPGWEINGCLPDCRGACCET